MTFTLRMRKLRHMVVNQPVQSYTDNYPVAEAGFEPRHTPEPVSAWVGESREEILREWE